MPKSKTTFALTPKQEVLHMRVMAAVYLFGALGSFALSFLPLLKDDPRPLQDAAFFGVLAALHLWAAWHTLRKHLRIYP